ncbi:MAG: D-alanine--D-alanine ligase [Deltaproteobacteria bacterium]|nr:D-alanine--D-alanine ligase [Deltaproteobacteria bacterium]
MKVGLTYDLKEYYLAHGMSREDAAEFDTPDTIEGIEEALKNLGFETDRIGNIFELTERLVSGDRWDMVFNIAEGVRGFGREAQVPALLEAYDIPYTFSDPLVLSVALHKGMTKHILRDIGVPTPDFQVINTLTDLDKCTMAFPLFAKPVAEGTGKGIGPDSKIKDKKGLYDTCGWILDTFKQPALLESFLPGREFTVGITGTREKASCAGVIEVILHKDKGAEPDSYSYANKQYFETRVEYRAVNDPEALSAVETSLAAWRGLGCRDGGRIDLRSDENGVPMFLEVNPLAGLNPAISDLPILCGLNGISYQGLIKRIMASALERINRPFHKNTKQR